MKRASRGGKAGQSNTYQMEEVMAMGEGLKSVGTRTRVPRILEHSNGVVETKGLQQQRWVRGDE